MMIYVCQCYITIFVNAETIYVEVCSFQAALGFPWIVYLFVIKYCFNIAGLLTEAPFWVNKWISNTGVSSSFCDGRERIIVMIIHIETFDAVKGMFME